MALNGIPPKYLTAYMHTPVSTPPPGETANLVNPPRAKSTVLGVTIPLLILATFFVAMRIYTKKFIIKRLWWDDYFSILAWVDPVERVQRLQPQCAVSADKIKVVIVSMTGVFFALESHGAGVHNWNLYYADYIQVKYWSTIYKAFYIAGIVTSKLSILFQILRIFVPARRGNETMYWSTTILALINVIFYIIEFCLDVWQCSPRARIWNKKVPGRCIWASNIDICTAAFNVTSDIIMLVLPLTRIWRLRMSRRKKFGVSLIFSTGLVAVVTSIMRLCYSLVINNSTWDMSYYDLILGFCLHTEVVVGVLVGCMPTLPKYVTQLKASLPSLRSRLLSGRLVGPKSNVYLEHRRSLTAPGDSRKHLREGAYELRALPVEQLQEEHPYGNAPTYV